MKSIRNTGRKLTEKTGLFLILLVFLISCSTKKEQVVQRLDTDWKLKSDTLFQEITTTIPGCVHTDLFENKLIPDPFSGTVEESLLWIADRKWNYELTFEPSTEILHQNVIELVFEGIDTYANIYLNDSLLFFADNMFRLWKTDVTKVLKQDENVLRVEFFPIDSIQNERIEALGIKLPEPYAFTRKAAFQFGWDWSPKYKTMGLWKPVYLTAWSQARLDSPFIYPDQLTKEKAAMIFEVDIEAETACAVTLQLFNETEKLLNHNLTLQKGINHVKLPFEIENPVFWFPKELGEPYLYQFEVVLGDESKRVYDTKSLRTGIRDIQLIRETDSIGESFLFKINGQPLYAKGANYIPEDNFPNRMSADRTRKLLSDAVAVNMNMLRIWGGGIYPDDYFFEICDSLGILVWQDFMFANTMYPDNIEFFENVKIEATQQIKRIRNHPSLALWCGNNEIDEGYHNWGWQQLCAWDSLQDKRVKQGFDTLFKDIFGSLVESLDPKTAYWHSSPSKGWGRPESLLMGDVHYWGVWWGEQPFEMYKRKVGRFNSEFGFQSYPDYKTMLYFADSNQLYFGSPQIEAHQKHPRGTRQINDFIKKYFYTSPDFESYIYASQLVQLYGMQMAIDAQRSRMPRSMGSLYWQLNDSWPVVSWSSIDYFGRWKALHYGMRESYAPILLGMDTIEGKPNVIWIVNESNRDLEVELSVLVLNSSSNFSMKHPLSIKQGEVVFIPNMLTSSTIDKIDKNSSFVHLELKESDQVLAERFVYFVYPNELHLPKPDVTIRFERKTSFVELTVESQVFVKNIQLLSNVDGHFDQNYFDMLPNKSYTVKFYPSEKYDSNDLIFSCRSLYDLIRNNL